MDTSNRFGRCALGLAVALAVVGPVVAAATTPAGAAPVVATETLVGTATIAHAPVGWTPSNFYLQLCPAGETFSMSCAGQTSGSPDQTTGAFTVIVPATPWDVGMYYYTANGQIILSKGTVVAPRPGATIPHDVTMSYVVPAVAGKVRLTGAPKNFGSLAYMGVQACPASAAFTVGCGGGAEAYESVGPGSSYLIDLRHGRWTVAAYYRNHANTRVVSGTPVGFTAIAGSTRTVNVTMAYEGV